MRGETAACMTSLILAELRRFARRRPRRVSLDLQELDVEYEHSGGGARPCGLVAVGELPGDPEACLFALDHELHPFGPAFDDAVQHEARRGASLNRAVEELSVGGPSAVMHGDAARRGRVLLAFAVGANAIRETGTRLTRGGRSLAN